MPFPLRAVALALSLVPVLTACGTDNTGSVLGQVNDASGRVCVIDAKNLVKVAPSRIARCYEAAADVLSTLAVGDCVQLDYTSPGGGRLPHVTSLAKSTSCPPPNDPR